MKTRLIHKYFELREARQWAAIRCADWESMGLLIEMQRVDLILHERYGYDVSLTHKN